MKRKSLLFSLLLICFACSAARAQMPADKPVVKLDPALDALISPDAKLELVKNDFGFTEGIVWVDQGSSGYLLLSDMYANVIYKVTPDGKVSLYLDHSGYTGYDIWRVGMPQPDPNRKDTFFMIGSNGLALDRQGRLLIATWSGRSIDRMEKDGKRTILARPLRRQTIRRNERPRREKRWSRLFYRRVRRSARARSGSQEGIGLRGNFYVERRQGHAGH